MKITVELSDSDLKDVVRFTGERKKGPAIRKFVADELALKRRAEGVQRVLSGEWRVDMPPWLEQRKRDKATAWPR